jgi:hypothetical protein
MGPLATQFDGLRRLATAAMYLNLAAATVAIGFGVNELAVQGPWRTGAVLLAAGVFAAVFGVLVYCQALLALKFASNSLRMYEAVLEMNDLLRRQADQARTIAENSTLSDWAKRIVYREKDYEFLRDTIQAAIVRQDWNAAEHLINDLGREFGYADEASFLRGQLAAAQKSTTEERIAAAVARFEQLCASQKWTQAQRECERLKALFPGDTRIASLPQEIELRRQEYKRKLLKEYDHAVRTHDVDAAHRLLIQLDQYLAPKEADTLKESARSVFRAKLEQMRAQFSIAVSYKQFRGAVEIAENLIREFPNSGYAQEISKLMPVLRERAAREASAHATVASS